MGAESPVLEASGLVKRFRGLEVLRGVDLRILPGELVFLYGPNGAGKTTLLRVLATLSRPHGGSFRIGGIDAEERPDVRGKLYYAGHGTQLYDDMNPEENLRFFTGLHGIEPQQTVLQQTLETVGLWRFRTFSVGTFSAGMKRRLGLARILLLRPAVLLLDEPYTSLDAAGIALVNRILGEFAAGGGAALIASHSPELSKGLEHRSVWLHGGRLQSEAPRHVA